MTNAKKMTALLLALLLCVCLVACGGEKPDPTEPPTSAPTEASTTEPTEAKEWNCNDALAALQAEYPADKHFLVLSGIVDNWAPVIMTLEENGTYICRVDYAGQIVQAFDNGTYEVNDDGSITATSADGKLVHEIKLADGVYTLNISVPAVENPGDITGTK